MKSGGSFEDRMGGSLIWLEMLHLCFYVPLWCWE